MPINVYYTDKMNIAEYSDAIDTVAYDSVTDQLHVIWHNNQCKVYSYYALPGAFSKIVDNVETTASVRGLVMEVTGTLQRAMVTDNAELVGRSGGIRAAQTVSIPLSDLTIEHSSNSPFVVTLQVDAEYQFEINALDFNDAAAKAKELFNQHVTSGGASVVGVKRLDSH